MTSEILNGDGRLFLEDLAVGQRFQSRTHTITAGEIKRFAADFDPQPFHLDEGAAEASFFKGLAASGWHTAAITMRLVVEAMPLAGGVIGSGGDLRWLKPTRPGDALTVEMEVAEITPSRSRPDRGSALVQITTRNQHGEAVQTFAVKTLLARRETAAD
ncbi:MAG: MaoC family dehydratase [Hyphomicrobium sp.]